jgi:hypothetical protein
MIIVLGEMLRIGTLVVIAGALVYKYWRTGDRGFLWLGLPVVVLPALPIGLGMRWAVDRLQSGEGVGFFPFTLVERGQMSIGSLLSLVGSCVHTVYTVLILIGILLLYSGRKGEVG